jgi:hypothetical protein
VKAIESLDAACPFELMKFTLTYDGDLPSAGNGNARQKEKWAIRRALHPQLASLWTTDPILINAAKNSNWGTMGPVYQFQQHHSKPDIPKSPVAYNYGVEIFGALPVGDKFFLPLVRESAALICGLDILFLRKEEPGALVKQGGDLDNRIKTLFDALRVPSKDEMTFAGATDPELTYCLLQEDSLISDVAIRTDRLLTSPNAKPSEVRLVIGVTVKVTQLRQYDIQFVG